MNKTLVESTTLLSLAYDEARELLQLEFCSGPVYWYFGIPPSVHEALRNAPSKGSYFNKAIRGRYPYAQAATEQAREAGKA
jgi:lysyl-tRNA synthetase, class II